MELYEGGEVQAEHRNTQNPNVVPVCPCCSLGMSHRRTSTATRVSNICLMREYVQSHSGPTKDCKTGSRLSGRSCRGMCNKTWVSRPVCGPGAGGGRRAVLRRRAAAADSGHHSDERETDRRPARPALPAIHTYTHSHTYTLAGITLALSGGARSERRDSGAQVGGRATRGAYLATTKQGQEH